MHADRHVVSLTTDAQQAATGYTPVVTGRVLQIHYVKDDFTNGVDFTITSEATGQTIWTESNVDASAIKAPRRPTHSTDGVAALYATGGTAVNDHVCLAADRVKIAIANGGVGKFGTFHVVIG